MKFSKEINQVVFDLDHTLWDFNKNSKTALTQIYADLNLNQYLPSFDLFYRNYIEVNDELWAKYRKGLVQKDYLRSARFLESFKHFDFEDNEVATKMGDEYVRISPHQTNLLPNTLEILSYLSKKYPLHILTNGFQEIQNIKLTKSGLLPFFETITCSEEIGVNKPNVEIFRHVESKIEAKEGEIVMIGDNLEADIDGALNAGWEAIYFGENQAHKHSVNDLIQIKEIL